jgi:type I restriction enzyme M protein
VLHTNLSNLVWKLSEKLRGFVPVDKYHNVIFKLLYISREARRLGISNDKEMIEFLKKYSKSNSLLSKALNDLPQDLREDTFSRILNYLNFINQNIKPEEISDLIKLNISPVEGFEESTPDSIVQLIKKDLENHKFDSILDIGSGSGSFFMGINELTKNKEVSAVEINHSYAIDLEIRLAELDTKKTNIFEVDCLRNPLFDVQGYKNKYDIVFSNYPFSFRADKDMYSKFDEVFKDGINFNNQYVNNADWLYISLILNYLNKKGRGYAISTLGVLFRTPDKKFREELLHNEKLLAVIELPGNLFNFTSISTCLMIFGNNSNKKVRMVNGSEIAIKGRRKNEIDVDKLWGILNRDSDISKNIDYAEIAKNEYNLLPSRYLSTANFKLKNPTPLKNVVEETFRGYQITAADLDKMVTNNPNEFDCELLTLSDISEFGVINSNLKKIQLDGKDLSRYYLKDNDILVSSKSTKIKVSLFRQSNHKNVLVTGSIIVVRTNQKKINPGYLALFLQSNVGKELMQSIQSGSVIFNINNSSLEKMDIPLIAFNEQKSIFDDFMVNEEMILNHEKNIKTLREKNENLLSTFFGSNL